MNNGLLKRILLWNRERKYTRHLSTNLFRRVIVLLGMLLVLVAFNSVMMISVENMALVDAIWLSATTVTTVGYGDFAPSSLPGRISTIICMYIFAITVMTQLIGEVLDWRTLRDEKKRQGYWEWSDMQDHIQIINIPATDAETYLHRLVGQIQETPELKRFPIQLLSDQFTTGLPDSLKSLRILHRSGEGQSSEMLRSVNVSLAKFIIVLARDSSDSISDSLTYDILSRISEIQTNATIVVEAVKDENRTRFLAAGASVVLRPIRAYPELLVRAMTDPGTEQVMEDLFRHQGVHLTRFDVSFSDQTWSDIVCRFASRDAGTPVGYVDLTGSAISEVNGSSKVSGQGLICMVHEHQPTLTQAQLLEVLAS